MGRNQNRESYSGVCETKHKELREIADHFGIDDHNQIKPCIKVKTSRDEEIREKFLLGGIITREDITITERKRESQDNQTVCGYSMNFSISKSNPIYNDMKINGEKVNMNIYRRDTHHGEIHEHIFSRTGTKDRRKYIDSYKNYKKIDDYFKSIDADYRNRYKWMSEHFNESTLNDWNEK